MLFLNNLKTSSHHLIIDFQKSHLFLRKWIIIIKQSLGTSEYILNFPLFKFSSSEVNLLLMKCSSKSDHLISGSVFRADISKREKIHLLRHEQWLVRKEALLRELICGDAHLCFPLIFPCWIMSRLERCRRLRSTDIYQPVVKHFIIFTMEWLNWYIPSED